MTWRASPQMRRIICVGDLCCDLIVPYGKMRQALQAGDISKETTDRLQVAMQCGGSVGNTARHLGALGDNPIFVTPLKMDSLGDYLLTEMQKAGVDMRWVSGSERSNMYCVAVLDEDGERTMFCFVPPWADFPRFNEKSFLFVKEGIRHFEEPPILFTSGMAFLDDQTNNRSVLDFFRSEKENGAQIVFDLNVRAESYGFEGVRRFDMEEMIAMSDIVLGSGIDEFQQVTGCADIACAAHKLLERMQEGRRQQADIRPGQQKVEKEEPGTVIARDGGNPILVIGEGSDGPKGTIVETLSVHPVSTLGAGDSFDAKLLSELAKGKDILSAVKNASDYAGWYISTKH